MEGGGGVARTGENGGHDMKGRYQLKHDKYGNSYKYTKLEHAARELTKCIPAGEWFIWDRQDKCRIAV